MPSRASLVGGFRPTQRSELAEWDPIFHPHDAKSTALPAKSQSSPVFCGMSHITPTRITASIPFCVSVLLTKADGPCEVPPNNSQRASVG